jgi:hypothetical protein
LDTRIEVFYGILSLAIGGYLELAAQYEISLNGNFEILNFGGVLDFVGYLLIGLGLFFVIHAAVLDALGGKTA